MKKTGLATVSGLALCFAWFSWSTPFFLFAGFVPLFMAVYELTKNREKYSYIKVFVLSFLAFFIWNFIGSYWLSRASWGGMLAAVSANTVLMSLVMLVSYFVIRRRGWAVGLMFFAALWISFEKLHLEWELSWPWFILGNGFAFYAGLVQWYEYTGITGGSLWVLCSNILVFMLWKNRKEKQLVVPIYKNLILPAAVIFIPMLASLIIGLAYKEKGTAIEAVAIQPNLDPYSEKFYRSDFDSATDLIATADSLVGPKTWLIAAPETALPEYKEITGLAFNESLDTIGRYCEKYPQLSFITGASFVREYGYVDRLPSPTANMRQDGSAYDVYNAAVNFNSNSGPRLYFKSKLVPGVEAFPFRKVLEPLLGNLIMDFGGIVGSNVTQERRSVFKSHGDSLRIAPIICYEGIYGEFVGGYVRNGANVLCIISNDGWWGDTEGHKQLLAMSRLRAIETRLPIVRSANTGISAFISASGEIIRQSKYDEKIALKGEIPIKPEGHYTAYTKYGDYIARVAPFVAGLSLLASIFRIRRKQDE